MTEQEQARIEKVREAIRTVLIHLVIRDADAITADEAMDRIFKLKDKDGKPMLGIISDDLSLPTDKGVHIGFKAKPELTMSAQKEIVETAIMAYKQAEADMLASNFRRVIIMEQSNA